MGIPESDGCISPTAGEQAAIGGKGHSLTLSYAILSRAGTALQVPQLDTAIIAPGGQRTSIRAESEGPYHVGVCLPDQMQALATRFPHPHFPLLATAAQYCPSLLMATAQMASKAAVKTLSRMGGPGK